MSIPSGKQQQHLSRLLGGRGPHEVRRNDEQDSYDEHAERARRLEVLQRAESEFDPAPFDAEAARIRLRGSNSVASLDQGRVDNLCGYRLRDRSRCHHQ